MAHTSQITPAMVAYNSTVSDPRWSPSGARLAWVQATPGRADVVVAEWVDDGGTSAVGLPIVVSPDLAVAKPHPMSGGVLTWAGEDELVVCGRGGVLAVVSADGGPARVLPIEGRVAAPAVAPDGRTVAFVCETDDACAIALLALDGSQPMRIVSQADFAYDPVWSPDGATLVWHAWDLPAMPFQSSRIEQCAVVDGVPGSIDVVAGGDGVAVAQPRFSPDGARLAWCADDTGTMHLHVSQRSSSEVRVLALAGEHAPPTWGPGMRTYAWSPNGDAIAVNTNVNGFGALHLVAPEGDGTLVASAAVGRAWHLGLDWGPRGLVAIRSGAMTPRQLVHYADRRPDPSLDSRVGERTTIALGAPGGFRDLVEPEPVTWRREGVELHGLWWQPSGDGPVPVLVAVHGGPTDQARADWDARRAYFVDRGWAVFAPNPRGSTGYGREYAEAIAGEWGVRDVADIAAGVAEVVPARGGDPKRVVAMGGSSGGYLVLRLAIEHPELLAAAISVYGVTDLAQLIATTWRFESGYVPWLAGTDAATLRDRSPACTADRLSVPLLLLQGDEDVVVPLDQLQALLDALATTGTRVEHHVYAGEGHGWSNAETVLDELTRITAFLDGGLLARETPSPDLGR